MKLNYSLQSGIFNRSPDLELKDKLPFNVSNTRGAALYSLSLPGFSHCSFRSQLHNCSCTRRMWEFSVGLYMISIWPESLLLAAIYGVVESSSTALFGPIIGQLVDKLTYLKV